MNLSKCQFLYNFFFTVHTCRSLIDRRTLLYLLSTYLINPFWQRVLLTEGPFSWGSFRWGSFVWRVLLFSGSFGQGTLVLGSFCLRVLYLKGPLIRVLWVWVLLSRVPLPGSSYPKSICNKWLLLHIYPYPTTFFIYCCYKALADII